MTAILNGIGKIKCGTYEKIDVEGELRADVVAVEVFKIKGRCRINKLEAMEATLIHNLPSENKILTNMNLGNRKSEVGEIVCNRLVAYGLKAEKVVAEEVQLYEACEIGTLICKKKTYCSPDCVILNELEQ